MAASLNNKTSAKKLYLFRNEGHWALQHLPELKTVGEKAWQEFVESVHELYLWAFDHNIRIVNHEIAEIQAGIQQKINGQPTISMDPCITGDINLGASRIFLPGGKTNIGIREKPGFPKLRKQIMRIPRIKRGYILIEDDIFSGQTIKQIVRLIANAGVSINKIVVGIQVGQPRLSTTIESMHNYDPKNVIDHNDIRDLLAGAHDGGLVVSYPDIQLRVPYTLPLVDVALRSSIPREHALEFSQKIWQFNVSFWKNFPSVKVRHTDKCFQPMVSRWNIDKETPLYSLCEQMLQILNISKSNFTCRSKGIIWLDLNGTLITENTGRLTISRDKLRNTVREARKLDWQIGLCSDSPAPQLINWGARHGINGPVIAENGAIFSPEGNTVHHMGKGFNTRETRLLIEDWAQANSISLLTDTTSPEFEESQNIDGQTGISFGAGRIASISIFCLKSGKPDSQLANILYSYLKKHINMNTIDFSQKHGFIAIHYDNPSHMKGNILRWLGWELYKDNKQCWMIGDSKNDLTYAPALCPIGIVSHKRSACLSAELVETDPHTKGAVKLIHTIVRQSKCSKNKIAG